MIWTDTAQLEVRFEWCDDAERRLSDFCILSKKAKIQNWLGMCPISCRTPGQMIFR